MTDAPINQQKNAWNSLEIVKLLVGILTPIAILVIGSQFNENDKNRAERAAAFERVAEQRTKLWERLGPYLNDIYAYLLYVGQWKDLDAKDIVEAKRQADKIVYSNRPFFTDSFVRSYELFMDASFQTYNDMGVDAKPMTTAAYRKESNPNTLSGQENTDYVHYAYYNLLDKVAEDFGLAVTAPKRPRLGPMPSES